MTEFIPKVSKHIEAVPPSATLAITAKAKKMKASGINVVNFAGGEPDFNTPDFIIDSAIKSLHAGETKYTPVAGMPKLREVISEKFKKDNNLEYSTEQIMVNVGAKQSLFNIFQAILNPGDEIIIPSPYWVSYVSMAKLASASSVLIPTEQADNFYLHIDKLQKALTPKTKAIIINSPSNPTGAVYSRKNLQEIADFAVENKLIVISDEIYEKITYPGSEFISIGSLNSDIFKQTVTVNGLSKSHAMTGWRIGYSGGPKEIIGAAIRLQSHSTSGPTTFCQAASITALSDKSDLFEKNLKIFMDRRNRIVQLLNDIEGVNCSKPGGAFYVFPDVSSFYGTKISGKTIEGSLDFCAHLLETAQVAAVPGIAFGNDKHIRLSYATSIGNIEEGISRLSKFLKG